MKIFNTLLLTLLLSTISHSHIFPFSISKTTSNIIKSKQAYIIGSSAAVVLFGLLYKILSSSNTQESGQDTPSNNPNKKTKKKTKGNQYFQKEIENLQATIVQQKQITKTNLRLQQEKVDLLEQIEHQRNKYQETLFMNQNLQQAYEKTIQDYEDIKQHNEKAEAHAWKSIEILEQQLFDAQQTIKELKEKIAYWKKRVKKEAIANQQLYEENKTIFLVIENCKAKRNCYKKKQNELLKEISGYEKECENYEQECNQQEKDIIEMQRQIDGLEQQCKVLHIGLKQQHEGLENIANIAKKRIVYKKITKKQPDTNSPQEIPITKVILFEKLEPVEKQQIVNDQTDAIIGKYLPQETEESEISKSQIDDLLARYEN